MQKEKKDKHFIKKPIYPGGQEALRKFIRENLKYPREALENKVEGTVSLKYTINHLGKVIEAKVIKGLGFGCDEEAIRLAGLLKFEVPKTRKVKVKFHKDLHVHFRLPKKQQAVNQYQYQVTTKKTDEHQKQDQASYSYTVTIQRKN